MRYRIFLGAAGGIFAWLFLGALATSGAGGGDGWGYWSIDRYSREVAETLGLGRDLGWLLFPLLVGIGCACGYSWHMLIEDAKPKR
jgi:hypothetical protein